MTAAWIQKLQPASFAGVKFFVDTSQREVGRRTVIHEFPFRDDPAVDDLGRKARMFTIEAVILGNDYFVDRDRLISALEEPGAQELVHPYYGKRQVTAGPVQVRESRAEGGAAFFTIAFVETPKTATPTALPDTIGALQGATQDVSVASINSYTGNFDPTSDLTSAVATVKGFLKPLTQIANQLQADAQTVAAAQFAISNLATNTANLLLSPKTFTDAVQAAFANLQTTAVVLAYDFTPGQRPVGSSLLVQTEQSNFDTINRFLQQQALVAGGTALLTATFTSYDDAISARDDMTSRIDSQQEALVDDSLFLPLQALRAALVGGVPGPGSDLPKVLTLPIPVGLPSLVLAWRLYGAVELEQDILDRNQISNPLFLPAGAFQVLSSE